MTRDRATITTLTLLTLALALAAPAPAVAGSLLSGYGGPGQGSQAILGATLLNGPSGGSPGAGGAAEVSGSLTGAEATSAGAAGVAARSAGHAHRRAGAGAKVERTSGKRPQTYSGVYGQSSSQASVGSSPTLGLSGADLLYVLLALGALALTGATTVQLTRKAR